MKGGSCLRTALCLMRGRRWSRGAPFLSVAFQVGVVKVVRVRVRVRVSVRVMSRRDSSFCTSASDLFLPGDTTKGKRGEFSGPDTGRRNGGLGREAAFFQTKSRDTTFTFCCLVLHVISLLFLFSFVLYFSFGILFLGGRGGHPWPFCKGGTFTVLAFGMIHLGGMSLFIRPCFTNHSHVRPYFGHGNVGPFGYCWCCGVDVSVDVWWFDRVESVYTVRNGHTCPLFTPPFWISRVLNSM